MSGAKGTINAFTRGGRLVYEAIYQSSYRHNAYRVCAMAIGEAVDTAPMHPTERAAFAELESGTADQEDIAAAELYTGVLHTLIAMRRPVGSVGACAGRKWLGDAVAEACAEIEADRRTIDRAICRGCGVTVDPCVCNRTPTTSSTEGK